MKLHYFGSIALGFAMTACGLGHDADIGTEKNQPIGIDGGDGTGSGGAATGTGAAHGTGATQGSGSATGTGATHGSGGATHGSGGTTTSTGGSTTSTGGATHGSGGATGTGPKCGSKVCPADQVCCNASCGVCTPPGFACDAIACVPEPTPVDAGHPGCVDNVACALGNVWSPTQCTCVPAGAACTTAADCHLVSDYCGGCNCLALGKGEKQPQCATETVQCLLDPCQLKTAACTGGHCTAE
jgi:hypothetical protein